MSLVLLGGGRVTIVAVMARALVTGSGDRVAAVAELLADEGLDVATATGLDDLPDLGGLHRYVQLPVEVQPTGGTLVGRVRSFLSEGLLGRFALVDRLLPVFDESATVVLVSGNTPTTAVPDDGNSRLALLHVLAHATRAELGGTGAQVTVVNGSRTNLEIARFALRGGEDPAARLLPAEPAPPVSDKQYEDWRTEVMGLVRA
jgi:hypothetical protein